MKPEEIFSAQEIEVMRDALAQFREPGAYQPGKWMVSPLNRRQGRALGQFQNRPILRDITLRTIEQMPGIVSSAAERLEFLRALAEAGVPEIMTSCFRRGHTLAEMQAEVQVVRQVAPGCKLSYGNAVKPEEFEMAAAAGYPIVQVWHATFLGKAMPASAGALYHRVWHGKDWHDLRFPASATEHIDRARRLVNSGTRLGLAVSAMLNLVSYATDDYVAEYCQAMHAEGAHEVILTDTAGGCGPEAIAHLVQIAKAAAPGLRIGVHTHNLFGLAVATSLAGARAGAEVIEVSVNGYEVGPAGVQASLAATAVALEALYGVSTGIQLNQMAHIARLGATLTGLAVPWNEPVLGSAIFETAGADEYEQEARFDALIHSAITAELVGAEPAAGIGATTGPLGMWEKLSELGLNTPKELVEPILSACMETMYRQRAPLTDAMIRDIALRLTAQSSTCPPPTPA